MCFVRIELFIHYCTFLHFRVTCDDCGDDIAAWISGILGKPCRLVRQNMNQRRLMKAKKIDDCQGNNGMYTKDNFCYASFICFNVIASQKFHHSVPCENEL